MSADVAFHVWILLVALIAFIGSVVTRITSEIPLTLRLLVIGGLLGGLILYRLTRKR